MEDYTVDVGVGSCKVTRLTDNLIVCQLPEKLPSAAENHYGTDGTGESDERLPAVTVRAVCYSPGHPCFHPVLSHTISLPPSPSLFYKWFSVALLSLLNSFMLPFNPPTVSPCLHASSICLLCVTLSFPLSPPPFSQCLFLLLCKLNSLHSYHSFSYLLVCHSCILSSVLALSQTFFHTWCMASTMLYQLCFCINICYVYIQHTRAKPLICLFTTKDLYVSYDHITANHDPWICDYYDTIKMWWIADFIRVNDQQSNCLLVTVIKHWTI